MISASIDFKILVLNIKYTKIGQANIFTKVLYGFGIQNTVNSAVIEKDTTYNKSFLLLVSIFNILVKSNAEIYASKKVNGEQIIKVNTSFSVVKALQIVCRISIF